MSIEQWRPVPDFEGHYEVSDHGRVRSVTRDVVSHSDNRTRTFKSRILSPELRHGYNVVQLSKGGIRQKLYVHRLVLMAFVGEPEPGMECCHNNDIRDDNRLVNLRWDTHQSNVDDCRLRGRVRNHNVNRTHCRRGHEFNTTNTILGRDGRRGCRKCKLMMERERYRRNKALGITRRYNDSQRTHCRRGHELSPANTYLRASGKRDCVRCMQLTSSARAQRNKSA